MYHRFVQKKTRGENWDSVPEDVASYARSFGTKELAEAEYSRLRFFAPTFSPTRAPTNHAEWDMLARLQALRKQIYCFEVEERRERAERKKVKQDCDLEFGHTYGSRGGRVRCVTAICRESSDTSGEIYGQGPRSVAAALAILGKRCSCGAGWHQEG